MAHPRRSAGAVVLMYHGLGQPAPRGEAGYTVTAAAFGAQLDLLRGRVVSLEDLLAGRAAPGAVVLTFDDGEASVHGHALPALRAAGMTATCFVTTGWIGQPGYLTAAEIRELHEAGWTIGAHGVTHRYLSDLEPAALGEELTASRATLAGILGQPPLHLSLPGGRRSPRVRRAAREAGYGSICTSVAGTSPVPPEPWNVRRLTVTRELPLDRFQRLLAGDRWLLLEIRARERALAAAKRLLGNRRYAALRCGIFALRGRSGG